MQLPTVKQLRYLIALEEQMHFGKAAASCFVSQSAFSTAIKELETTLNVRLVDRTNKSVVVTDIGRSIINQAHACLNDVETLVQLAASRQEPLSGRLTLGVIPTIAPFILPKMLPGIHEAFSNLELYLHEDKTLSLHKKLLQGKLDLILIALPYELRDTTVMPLFKDPFFLAHRRKSQWIKDNNSGVDFEVLPEESVLLLEDGHCLRDHALQACDIHDTDKINRFAATSLETLLQMVAMDLGVTFVPAMAKDALRLNESDINIRPLSKGTHRSIGLAWRKSSGRDSEFTMLGQQLQKLHEQ